MSRYNRARRVALLCGASMVAVAALTPTLSLAQEAQTQPSDGATTVDEVVVTGIRAQLRSAQAIKQNSEVIVDSITAVDIGALPDRSVSEALQRISGITLQRTNEARDPARLAAEGGGVFIRGLSWVRSETNGRDIFSARNGRGLSFEDISADLLAGVDVFKNPAANQIEGGIGGTVNLKTRLPFDQSGRLAAISADYNYGDLIEEGYWSGSAIFSDRWQTKIGEIGLLANFSLSNVGNRTNSITTDRFDPVTTLEGDTVYQPKYLGWRDGRWEQERTAYALAVQWRPTEDLTFTAQGFYSKADPTNIERVAGLQDGTTLCPSTGLIYDNGVLTGGTMTGVHAGGWGCYPTGAAVGDLGSLEGITYDGNIRYGEDHKTTGDYSLNVRYTPGNWEFSGDIQYVKSTAELMSLTVGTQRSMLNTDPLSAIVNIGGSSPSLNITGGDLNRPQDYYWGYAMDHVEDNEGDSLAWRGDATYNFDNDGFIRSVSVGYRGTDKTFTTRQTNWNWSILSAQYWGMANNNGGVFSYPAVYLNDGTLNAALPSHTEFYAFDNFFRGDIAAPGGFWLPTASTVNQGREYANSLFSAITGRPWPQGQGWGWSPVSTDFANFNPGGDNPTAGVTEQDEKTHAIYTHIRFGSDTLLPWPVDGNIGVRVVKTEASTQARVQLPSLSSPVCPGPDATACAAFNQALAFSQGGVIQGVDTSNDYTEALPSLNVRLHLRDDLQLRFAASRAMVRPDFNQMQPYTTLAVNFGPDGYTPNPTAGYTGTGGNPNLKPIMADQFDASLEWYFAPQGSLTAAVFRKKIKDYIYSGVSRESFTNNGVTLDFDVTRQMNGEEGTVQGFEIAYQQFFDFLPGPFAGFGVQANYTYIDSDGGRNTAVNVFDPNQNAGGGNLDLPLEGMSPTSYNLAGLYERGRISARLAWNWREKYLLTTSAANINAPVWSEDYGQLDGSVFFTVNDRVKLGVQATNLTQERTILRVGYGDRMPRYSWVDTDRRVAVVLRARF
ncbi:TonB-dependent receptor [uncultured Brevundimonas sp.]|uniref:TonB-dependent receptor n=1 Tax=Brevundimonas sp. CEF1 TaxID=3442642 RepID=UPI0025CE9867|nr:TonB-dependent receptor [uncultured Brevundimonas sp.]